MRSNDVKQIVDIFPDQHQTMDKAHLEMMVLVLEFLTGFVMDAGMLTMKAIIPAKRKASESFEEIEPKKMKTDPSLTFEIQKIIE